jgi:hypothetical protein
LLIAFIILLQMSLIYMNHSRAGERKASTILSKADQVKMP